MLRDGGESSRAPPVDGPHHVFLPVQLLLLVDHLEELRQRVFRSLVAIVIGALVCLLAVKPLVRFLEDIY